VGGDVNNCWNARPLRLAIYTHPPHISRNKSWLLTQKTDINRPSPPSTGGSLVRDRTVCNRQLRVSLGSLESIASAVTRTPSCSQHVSWSWSQTTDRCGEKARPNVCPPPFIVIAVHRHACQLIKFCSETATFYRRQSVVFYQWHPVRIAAGSIMAAHSSIDSTINGKLQGTVQ